MSYIAEGTYGCVFTPPLKCEKKTNKSQIGKIFQNKATMEEEKVLAEKIHNLDKEGKWTVRYFGDCIVNIQNIQENNDINKCNLIDLKTATDIHQLIYNNGGIDLDKLINNNLNNFYIDDLIELFLPLLKGLVVLNNQKLIHCDIKPSNILYNSELNKLYIIDFGLLTAYNEIGTIEKDYLLEHSYPYFPPEFKIYSKLILHESNINILDILCNYNFYNKKTYIDFMSQFIDIPTEINLLIAKSSQNKDLFKEKFNKEYVSKIDVYSLGMTFIEIIYNISKKHSIKSKIKNFNYFMDFIKTVIIPMIHIDPDKRCNAKEASNKLKILLKKYNIKQTNSSQSKSESKSPTIPVNNCHKLKRDEIIKLLKKQNKSIYGNKKILCDRLNNIATSPKPPISTAQKNCEKQKAIEIKKQLELQKKAKYGTKKQMCERLLS